MKISRYQLNKQMQKYCLLVFWKKHKCKNYPLLNYFSPNFAKIFYKYSVNYFIIYIENDGLK